MSQKVKNHTHPKQVRSLINENEELQKANLILKSTIQITQNKCNEELMIIIFKAQEKLIRLIADLKITSIDPTCLANLRKLKDDLFNIF